MTTLTQAAPIVKPTTLEIKNATYEARPIDPGFAGVAAVEVTKRTSGESYAVVLQADGQTTCECPDFLCRHADHGTACKHIRGVVAAGLLVAPVAAPAPKPAVPPVTAKDVKRAAYFGLTIPKAPVVAPAPVVKAPVEPALDLATMEVIVSTSGKASSRLTTAIRPADVREMREWLNIRWTARVVAPVAEVNPRDSWPEWTDADTWTTEAPTIDVEWSDLMRAGLDLRSAQIDHEVKAKLDRRARGSRGFVPTLDEVMEAVLLLADPRSSCLEGESAPPLGRRFRAPMPRPAWIGVNNTTDADNWPGGVC
jgi:hypothetical protein